MTKPTTRSVRTATVAGRTTTPKMAKLTKRETTARVKKALVFLAEEVDTAEKVGQRIATYLVATVFEGDWQTALEEPYTNPVWVELRGRVPTPAVRVSQDTLGRLLRVGAWDACIDHRAWDDLPITFKLILLPLKDKQALLSAALHATKMNLDTDGVRNYLDANLENTEGVGPTPARIRKQATGIASLGTAKAREKFVKKARALPEDRRKALRKELEAARDALLDVLGDLDD